MAAGVVLLALRWKRSCRPKPPPATLRTDTPQKSKQHTKTPEMHEAGRAMRLRAMKQCVCVYPLTVDDMIQVFLHKRFV